MLIFLSNPNKPQDAHEINHLVSAEIPDPQTNEELHNMVKKHMIHLPCGVLDPHCPYMTHIVRREMHQEIPKAIKPADRIQC
eukprot:gene9806-18369_t